MSSAICFNLDHSKGLSSGNGLMQLRDALKALVPEHGLLYFYSFFEEAGMGVQG